MLIVALCVCADCVGDCARECDTQRDNTEIIQRQTTQHNAHASIDAHPQLIGLFIARLLPGVTCVYTLRLAQREH